MQEAGLFKGITRIYKGAAILLLNALVVLGCSELIVRAASNVWTKLTYQEVRDGREHSSYYATEKWARQYWTEFGRVRKQQYHAFSVWRRAAFKGETINIDERGIRLTPGSKCVQGAFKVFTFGSSHMWGTGAPDWGTIPAHILNDLKETHPGPICMTNFGESGYVSAQSLVELVLQLQAGNVPDLTIFFDGAGDIFTGYQSGRVDDVHENFEMIAARFERRDGNRWPLAIQLIESLRLTQLVNNQVAKLGAAAPTTEVVTYETMHVDRTSLANAIARAYLSNYKTVDGLAKQYGFANYFFWPPQIAEGHKPLTSEEETLKQAVDPAFQKLIDSVYESVEKHAPPEDENLVSISDVFDNCDSLLWIDDAHTTPVGNSMIAERMVRIIEDRQSRQDGIRKRRLPEFKGLTSYAGQGPDGSDFFNSADNSSIPR